MSSVVSVVAVTLGVRECGVVRPSHGVCGVVRPSHGVCGVVTPSHGVGLRIDFSAKTTESSAQNMCIQRYRCYR